MADCSTDRCLWNLAGSIPQCPELGTWRFHPDALLDPPLPPSITAWLLAARFCDEHVTLIRFPDGMPLMVRVT